VNIKEVREINQMGAETLLTLVGLIAAVYALLPPERRLDLRIRLKPLDWCVITVAFLLIHYIQFYPVLSNLGVAPDLGSWRWGFDAENASYLTVLIALFFIFLRAGVAKVGLGSIGSLHALIERLVSECRYSEVLFLLGQHLTSIFKVYNQDFIMCRLRNLLIPQFSFPFRQSPSRIKRLRKVIARFIPSHSKEAAIATDIVRRVFVYEPFVSYLAMARPYFALEVLEYEFGERDEFLNFYIKSLLLDKNSILYHEIKHNQYTKGNRYIINEQNRFIQYFLNDANVAERLLVWRPFGNFALEYLDDLFRDKDKDPYNLAFGRYDEDAWECPLRITIWFFEAMVLEALHQGIRWHMWLYYFRTIVEKILRNLSPNPNTVELCREFPTPYHFLLYSIFHTLRQWIETAADLPPEQENIILNSEMLTHQENGNIPKSAIIALGECLRHVMLAQSVDERFKSYLLSMVLQNYFNLLKKPMMQKFARVLLTAIVKGGAYGAGEDKDYIANLRIALRRVDRSEFMGQEWPDLLIKIEDQT
jgi:hypothetical protein